MVQCTSSGTDCLTQVTLVELIPFSADVRQKNTPLPGLPSHDITCNHLRRKISFLDSLFYDIHRRLVSLNCKVPRVNYQCPVILGLPTRHDRGLKRQFLPSGSLTKRDLDGELRASPVVQWKRDIGDSSESWAFTGTLVTYRHELVQSLADCRDENWSFAQFDNAFDVA